MISAVVLEELPELIPTAAFPILPILKNSGQKSQKGHNLFAGLEWVCFAHLTLLCRMSLLVQRIDFELNHLPSTKTPWPAQTSIKVGEATRIDRHIWERLRKSWSLTEHTQQSVSKRKLDTPAGCSEKNWYFDTASQAGLVKTFVRCAWNIWLFGSFISSST